MKALKHSKVVSICAILFFLLTLVLSISCKKQQTDISQKTEDSEVTKVTPMQPLITDSISTLDKLFTAAMIDAKNPEPHEISHNLINLKTDKNLIDTIINGERYIKMVSWKLDPKWYPKKGKFNNQNRVIWVTAAPIIQDSCRNYYKNLKDPNMRLRQLLGLQPLTVETFFLELWVRPKDMFRPAPDNETDDNTAGLNLPNDVTPQYRKWFNDTRAIQYVDCTDSLFSEYGYPWTQLGYTYDWSPRNPSNIGLSEFVIKANTDMYVSGEYPTRVYCSSD